MTTETVAQHHRYSASGASGWLTCAGKLVMEDGIAEKYSPAADEGSAAHFLGAFCLENGKNPADYHHKGIVCWELEGERDGQSFYGGDPLPPGAKVRSTWKVDREMVDNVTKYVDYVRGAVKGGTLLVEQRVHFGGSIGVDGAFGTSDTIILSEDGTELIIIDLKYGFREVSAKANSQMLLYSLGALNTPLEDPEDLIGGYLDLSGVTKIRMMIFQPRLQAEPDCPEWTCDLETLYAFADKAKAAIEACEQALNESKYLGVILSEDDWVRRWLKPSEKACQWCRAKPCPALTKECLTGILVPQANTDGLFDLDRSASLTAGAESDNATCVTELDGLTDGIQQAVAKIPTLDFATIARLYSARKLFATWQEAVEQRMNTEMLNGAQHEDWKLVQGRAGHRAWQDPDEVESIFKAARIKVDDMYDKKLISPTNAERLLKKEKPKIWKKVQPLITRSEGSLTIVPASDKRPAINPMKEALLGLPDLSEELDTILIESGNLEMLEFDDLI